MHIGCDPKGQDAQSENTEEQPADKAEMQAEQAPFVALHQLHRIFARGVCAPFFVLRAPHEPGRANYCRFLGFVRRRHKIFFKKRHKNFLIMHFLSYLMLYNTDINKQTFVLFAKLQTAEEHYK